MYKLLFTKASQKDATKLAQAHLKEACQKLLDIISQNPYQTPPPYEKLVGDLSGCISRRINLQHRLVYQVIEDIRVIKVLRMWSHYE